MIARRVTALAAVCLLLACGDSELVQQAPVALPASPAAAFADGSSLAVATVLDDGTATSVTLSADVEVAVRVYNATVTRASQPTGARALTAGARATLDVHTAVTQYDSAGNATGRVDNPFAGAAGRAHFSAGLSYLTVLGDDVTDPAAWRVFDAYALDASGAALAEPALGFAVGTSVDTLFTALHPP